MEATAEEGRDCSNQLNPLNEQLIGGCLDRKLEEVRRRRRRERGAMLTKLLSYKNSVLLGPFVSLNKTSTPGQ